MKGLVVEIRNDQAVVLYNDGSIIKIPNDHYQIGQEVNYMKKQISFKRPITLITIAASLLLMTSLGLYAYYSPYSYISLDVNPSIEYSVNWFNKVLTVTGVNDDGTTLIQAIDLKNLKHKDINTAISMTIDELLNSGYLMEANSGIIITTSSHNMEKANDLVNSLEDTAKVELETKNPNIIIMGEAVGAERVAEARELGVTPGKLNLVEKLMESAGISNNSLSDNSISDNAISGNYLSENNVYMTEWLHRSVKDILAETNRYREQNREEEKNKTNDSIKEKNQNREAEQNGEVEQNGETEQNQQMEQNSDNELNQETEQNQEREQNIEHEQNSDNEIKNQENNSNKEKNTEHKNTNKNTNDNKNNNE